MEPAHLLGTGGAIGAVLRYAVGLAIVHDRFPFGTLAVNLLGSFVVGLVAFAGLDGEVVLFVAAGACGSFTTYASFSVQTVRMWESGESVRACGYALGTLVGCLLAAGTGAAIALAVTG